MTSVITPEKVAVYTVEFGTDGQVIVVGGCNRGSGTCAVDATEGAHVRSAGDDAGDVPAGIDLGAVPG